MYLHFISVFTKLCDFVNKVRKNAIDGELKYTKEWKKIAGIYKLPIDASTNYTNKQI